MERELIHKRASEFQGKTVELTEAGQKYSAEICRVETVRTTAAGSERVVPYVYLYTPSKTHPGRETKFIGIMGTQEMSIDQNVATINFVTGEILKIFPVEERQKPTEEKRLPSGTKQTGH